MNNLLRPLVAAMSLIGTLPAYSLSLDFAKQEYNVQTVAGGSVVPVAFGDWITFTRSTLGSRFNAAGQFEMVAPNIPRFDYDPVTKQPRGLLVEEGRTNLLSYSDQLNNAVWTKTATSVVAANDVDPAGALNAWHIRPNAGTGIVGRLSRTFSAVAGTSYTFVVFAKKKDITFLRLLSTGATANTAEAYFDLTLGIPGGVDKDTTAKATDVGNGWVRCAISFAATVTGTCTVYAQPVAAIAVAAYTGDGNRSLLLAFTQAEAGGFPTSHMPTTAVFTSRAGPATYIDSAGVMQTAATNVARSNAYGFDAAGALKPVGLLIEGAATNALLYSEDFTHASWIKSFLTATNVAATSPAGGATVSRLKLSAGTDFHFCRKWITQDGKKKTLSAHVKKSTSHAFVGLRLFTGQTYNFDMDAGVFVTALPAGVTSSVTKGADGWYRIGLTAVHTVDGFVGVTPLISTIVSDFFTATGDEECYVWGIQLEEGDGPSAYIGTTTAQVTRAADVTSSASGVRAADVASVNTLAPWFNPLEGVLFAESQSFYPPTSIASRVASLFQDPSNYISLYRAGTRLAGADVVLANVGQIVSTTLLVPDNTSFKTAIAYKANDAANAINGNLSAADTSIALPAPTSLQIGQRGGGAAVWNGYIRSIKYYPTRLPAQLLHAITA